MIFPLKRKPVTIRNGICDEDVWPGALTRGPVHQHRRHGWQIYNNNGGKGGLDLDSGIFTCGTPGYYTVSYSANAMQKNLVSKKVLVSVLKDLV